MLLPTGSSEQGMVWIGMENGMERKFRYEIWKMPEWNGMEDFKNGMEDNLPYFHTNSNLDFVQCMYKKKIYIRMSGSDHTKYIAICSIGVIVDDFDRIDFFLF